MNHFARFCLIGGMAFRAWAGSDGQPVTSGQHAELKDPLARQRQSVLAMRSSLAAQREAIRKQVGRFPAGSFSLSAAAPRTIAVSPAPACDPLPDTEVDWLVGRAADREGLDPDLLRGVMRQESGYRPCALSGKGAMGLMQLMPATASQLGVADPFDPQENLDGGARFLKQLLLMYGGDVGLALGAYNAGPAKVNAYGGIPLLPETMDYVQRVLSLLPALQ